MATPAHLRQSPVCTVEDCDKPTVGRSLCSKHYKRWQRHGTPTPASLRAPDGTRSRCRLEGCQRPRGHRDGWCTMHGRRVDKTGNPGPVESTRLASVRELVCVVGDCGKPAKTRGMCSTHYSRWRRHGDPQHVMTNPARVRPYCSDTDCEKAVSGRGMCSTHYAAWRRSATFEELTDAGLDPHPCYILSCRRPALTRGMCDSHYTAHRARIRRAQIIRQTTSPSSERR